jgi:two-component system chemotaxis response regulator CheB
MNKIVVISSSANELRHFVRIVASLSAPCSSTFLLVRHIGTNPCVLPALLSGVGELPVGHPVNGTKLRTGHLYVAPPDFHMVLKGAYIRLHRGPKVHGARPAADPLFISAAESHGERVVGVILSGQDEDGLAGLRMIKRQGGAAIIQDPGEIGSVGAAYAAFAAEHPVDCLNMTEIAERLIGLC